MSLRKTIEIITKLANQGVIRHYAITGAIAVLNYIQPTLTEDVDILISISDFGERPSGLIVLAPIEKALAGMGYHERTDLGYMIEGWPVQFLPAASELDQEALERAVNVEIDSDDGEPFNARCLTAEHIVATALKVGRLKDLARIEAFLVQRAVDLEALRDVLARHGLTEAWQRFCVTARINDPLDVG